MVTHGKVVSRFKLVLICTLVFLCLAAISNASQKDVPSKVDDTAVIAQVNINTATVEQLIELPGIGPALAERIIKYRKEFGAFNAPADLIAVKGVGPKKLDKIIALIVVE